MSQTLQKIMKIEKTIHRMDTLFVIGWLGFAMSGTFLMIVLWRLV